jgi:diguanylate cyclase (GGDEF)-like protein
MIQRLERHATLIFVVALLTIAGGVALANYRAARRLSAERLVLHTHDILSELDAVVSELNEAESKERGYELSGDESLVTSFERASMRVEERLANASALDADNDLQKRRLDNLALASRRALAAMRAAIDARRSGSLDSSALAHEVEADESVISGIRDSVAALERDERALLAARRRALDASSRHTFWTVFALGATSMAMLAVAYLTARSALRRARLAEHRTVDANNQLSLRVTELMRREHEITGLQRLSEALQLCLTSSEAYAAVARIIPALAETSREGFLAVTNASSGCVERVAAWGALAADDSIGTMASEDCCALRSGRPYVVRGEDGRLRCVHVSSAVRDYVCLPLLAHGETLGILHVTLAPGRVDGDSIGEPASRYDDEVTALYESNEWPGPGHDGARLALLRRAGGQIAVALANLALRERLEQQSVRDPLTGAFNRRYFEESLRREILRANRNGRGLALVMLDIDHFKQVNDTHGHDAGDEILRNVADVLHRSVREADVVCRYGGEEFAVLLPEISPETARVRAQGIVDACRARRVVLGAGRTGQVTISAGLAHLSAGDGGAELIRRADTALYAAKHAGRDRLVEAGSEESSSVADLTRLHEGA